jgi:hypothetical protein
MRVRFSSLRESKIWRLDQQCSLIGVLNLTAISLWNVCVFGVAHVNARKSARKSTLEVKGKAVESRSLTVKRVSISTLSYLLGCLFLSFSLHIHRARISYIFIYWRNHCKKTRRPRATDLWHLDIRQLEDIILRHVAQDMHENILKKLLLENYTGKWLLNYTCSLASLTTLLFSAKKHLKSIFSSYSYLEQLLEKERQQSREYLSLSSGISQFSRVRSSKLVRLQIITPVDF